METEQWKQIKGYEGLYEISSLGQVRSTKRTTSKGGLLKPQLLKNGYFGVNICKDGKPTLRYIHRLVAEHFIDKTDYRQNLIDHINGIKTDNRLENLRWVTSSQNAMNSFTPSNNTSGTKGVYFVKGKNKWKAELIYENKIIRGGKYYNTKEEAIERRKELEKEYYGDYAKIK